jgi:hypothetical protein
MKTKIRIFCWWTDDHESIVNRTLSQLNVGNFLDKYEFVYDDSYEWAIVYGKLGNAELKTDKQHTIFFGMEPTWSNNTDRSAVDYSDWVFVQDRRIFDHDNEKVIESPNFMLYAGHGDGWNLDEIAQWDITKSKNMSMIVTKMEGNLWWVPENAHHIYFQRTTLAEEIISRELDIDVFGRGWDTNGRCFGHVGNKKDALLPYKFSIGIENTSEQHYITEKFTDILLTNTVPVYFGSTTISDHYDSRGFIQLPDLNDVEACVEVLRDIENNTDALYEKMLPFVQENKNRYLQKFNILNKIQEIIG